MKERTRRRTTISAGVAAVVLLVTAGCAQSAGPQNPSTDTAMDRFLQQQIAFGPCDAAALGGVEGDAAARAECGTVTVPLDYDAPEGDVAEIAVLRVPARGPDRIGSILTNPGGPGASGTAMAPLLAQAWTSTPITERFDLIGFDPRGVGATTPAIDCATDAERDDDTPLFTPMSGREEWTEERAQDFVAECARRSGGENALAHVGTRDVARDMDIMRQVLGDEKLNFAGASYGTRLGAVYAQMFPQNVRALVLDGALDPTHDKQEWRVSQFTGMQAAFDDMAELCIQQGDCPLGTDPDKALDVYLDLVRGLDTHPAPTDSGRELNTVKAMDAVFSGLYSSALWPVVIKGLQQLRDGSGTVLLLLRDAYQGRAADGVYSNLAEANVAINCIDDNRHSREQETAYKRAVLDAAPFMDPGHVVDTTDVCAAWPGADPVRFDAGAVSAELPTVMVVSTTADPATPHRDGLGLADTLGASLLTVEGAQHGAIIVQNPCIEQKLADYLIDLTPPADGSACAL
ncbi:alpha/beta hydrolase [Nocardia sp. NPDC058176]|uniref:alpha/beta hydrolase n=1 Tax=Nocardia sp. NPDC058176 TaxID=3346368 RepID=UPI0036DD7270